MNFELIVSICYVITGHARVSQILDSIMITCKSGALSFLAITVPVRGLAEKMDSIKYPTKPIVLSHHTNIPSKSDPSPVLPLGCWWAPDPRVHPYSNPPDSPQNKT